jgi:2-desacetyl-2-hydroxyethyl bacteriochlorophyllide A dehydrogenase
MNAIVLEQPGHLKYISVEHPGTPAAHEVLLKIKAVGICGTDLHAFQGKQPFFSYPRILGHEIAAQVVEVGAQVHHVMAGDYCAVMPYRNLETDQAVRRGKTNCGSSLSVLGVHEDGAMQEYLICDASLVFPANGLTFDQIAIIEPLAIGSHAIERADIHAEDIVLIVGAGPIGIAAMAMGLLKSPRMMMADTNPRRLDFVRTRFSGVDTVDASENVVEQLSRLLNGNRPTIIIDATGNQESMLKCFDYVAHGGTIVYVGLFQGDIVFHDPDFHRKEITLKASRNAVAEDFRKIIRLLRSGVLHLDGYITHRLSYDNVCEEFPKLYLPQEQVIKAVIDF